VLAATAVVGIVFYLRYGTVIGPLAQLSLLWNTLTPTAKYFVTFSNIFILGQDVSLWLKLDPITGGLYFAFDALARTPLVNNFNILTPAWTIALELMFYVLAPFVVRRHVLLVAGLAVACFAFRFAAYNHGYYTSATAYRFFPFELGLFLAGTVSYRLYQIVKRQLSPRCLPPLPSRPLSSSSTTTN
jgi:peptidoglycan/LPS O-acetylase OafA/YrhL